MLYHIVVMLPALDELRAIEVHYRRRISDAIESQLLHEPARTSKNRKRLDGIEAGFEHVQPIWELRVGDWRVFYDIEEADGIVNIRAVRRKDPGKRTEDIIR